VCGERLTALSSKYITFYQHLVVGSGMDGLIQVVCVQIVVDMLKPESSSWMPVNSTSFQSRPRETIYSGLILVKCLLPR